jgi:dimethylhistidine N-methyltransferase
MPTGHNPDLISEVLQGLSAQPPRLASKYFYDAKGARLFEQICTLPEYYPTRCELEILRDQAADMAAELGAGVEVVEPGSGEGVKIRHLLRALDAPHSYRPMDVAAEQLRLAAARLREDFPTLVVNPVVGDFTAALNLQPVAHPRLFFFPGSTIGNFPPLQAQALLKRWAQMAGRQGYLLIGVDLRKNPAILHAAYNDRQGVTAAFNRNILAHVNRLTGADFVPELWEHDAFYLPDEGQIQMWLRASRPQQVQFPGHAPLRFAAGDGIRTEYSCKYDVEEFARLAEGADWQLQKVWTDSQNLFSLQLYRRAG